MSSRLQKRRLQLGLTQQDLGQFVGVDEVTVGRWERGESVPQRRFWPKLVKLTGLPIIKIITAIEQDFAS
jgi:transcriptional regulator with XRE-family HTH domain